MTDRDADVHLVHRRGGPALAVTFSFRPRAMAVASGRPAATTLLLDLIAGLRRPEAGWVRFHGETFVDVERRLWRPPGKRRVGLVPRGGALFPHLTVEENIAFGVRRLEPGVLARFHALVRTFDLAGLLARRPADLDLAETLRAAAVRALVPGPQLLLLDQPADLAGPRAPVAAIEELLERLARFEIPVLLTCSRPSEAPAGAYVLALDALA